MRGTMKNIRLINAPLRVYSDRYPLMVHRMTQDGVLLITYSSPNQKKERRGREVCGTEQACLPRLAYERHSTKDVGVKAVVKG